MDPKPISLKILDWASIIVLAVASYLVFFYAPTELVMGNVQRVFYFHVAAGWVGMLSFFIAMVAGIAFLRSDDLKWDIVALAAVELGLVFSFINIVTGAIWARPIWNTWWTWDPRLVTATIMELIYAAYLMLRQGIDNPMRRARFSAVYAILGFVSVPISYFSIRVWRSIHPVVFGAENPGADVDAGLSGGAMLFTFFFGLFAFTVIFVDLFWNRIRLGKFGEKIDQLKMKTMI